MSGDRPAAPPPRRRAGTAAGTGTPRRRPPAPRATVADVAAVDDTADLDPSAGTGGPSDAADEVARSLRHLTGLEVDPDRSASRSAPGPDDEWFDDERAPEQPTADRPSRSRRSARPSEVGEAGDTRREERLGALDERVLPVDEEPSGRRGRRARARKLVAPSPHPVVAWGVPVVLVVLGLLVVNLAFDAKDLVLNSRDGAIARNIVDPAAPGFAAEVVPTSTLLVLHTSDAGSLVGVALLSLVSADGGGTMAVFNEDLIVKDPSGVSSSLGQRYTRDGPDAVKQAVTRLVGADVDAVMNVGATVLEELIRPVAPLRYTLRDNVRAVQNGATVTLLRSGSVSIASLDQVRAATEVLGPGEATVNRVARQAAFWEAWFDALRAVPDASTVLPVYDAPIVRFAKSLGTGPARVVLAPFEQVTFAGDTLHLADVEATRALALEMIPYPKGYEPGARLLVELRNGTGELGDNDAAIRTIIAADGQLVLLGNTEAFGVVNSSVTFYDEALRSRVESLARTLGIRNVVFAERPGSSIEATVTIGADYTP